MPVLWGLLAAAALLWPDRIRSSVDGVPLDRAVEALLVGALFPALCVAWPAFLRTTRARALIVALVVWKAAAALLFVQDGWCARFEPSRPYAKDARGAPHAWDVRADWRRDDPACSAIVSRPYQDILDFPAWFFNLPPPDESWPQPEDRPPGATTRLRVSGYLASAAPGTLHVDYGPDMRTTMSVDGRAIEGDAPIAAGTHLVAIDAVLSGDRWAFVPLWNGRDLWSTAVTTVRRPPALQVRLHPWLVWVAPLLAALLLAAWSAAALSGIASLPVLAWMAAASAVLAFLLRHDHHMLARWSIAALALGALLRVPARLRSLRGGFLIVGVPWIVFVLVISAPVIGRWFLYGVGHDFWMYQRYGYRIVMQGYWLEGGSPTFWFQPLYRWISGLLHVVFGDSSVGEWWWDGACLVAGASLAFEIARRFAGWRWAIVAAALTLATFTLGNAWNWIGAGLGEISASGLMSAGALAVIAARRRGTPLAIAAGVCATLSFYTRLNHLVMAFGVASFALPTRMPVAALAQPRRWVHRVEWRVAAIVIAVVAGGVLLFCWRTWHYTGVFSLFYGTSRGFLSNWRAGSPVSESVRRTIASVMMVLTVNDPPRFDPFALPVLAGAGAALLALVGAPVFRRLPAAAVLFFVAAVAGAIVARGSAYPGRFSIHVMPITSALAVCAVAEMVRAVRRRAGADNRVRGEAEAG